MKRRAALLALTLLLCTPPCAAAAETEDPRMEALQESCINADCELRLDNDQGVSWRLTDGKLYTSVRCLSGRGFTLRLPEKAAGGCVFLRWENTPPCLTLRLLDAAGAELSSWTEANGMLEYRVDLPAGCAALELKAAQRTALAELYVFAPDGVPERAWPWEAPEGKTDLLLVSAHADDEIVMMGGVLPTYAGERGMRVQVAYMKADPLIRQREALDGLRENHVRRYPAFLPVYHGERAENAEGLLVELIRRLQPEVVVTHDLKGEYGKATHIATADSVRRAVQFAADARRFPESAERYGVWQVKKLYFHLYPEAGIRLDFDAPLASFGGKTAFEVAQDSFACHASQDERWLDVLKSNRYDCRLYGLAFSSVGADVNKDDFFENIPAPATDTPERLAVD